MPRATARYSDDEKRRIINEAYHISSPGVVATCKKYGLSPATIYKWKTALGITAERPRFAQRKPRRASRFRSSCGWLLLRSTRTR
ncbi:hypothetical protein [Ralstonia phage phiRSL1]|uniref:Transposase n=1 Tax=Ralstonia phage phiRSL1 TaxID=1980924 RepID=B2ZYG6_9CAUD|nr:hypothetical protein RSL1_ORF318 [Ralstonia phage phiRSL1]BAG41765.1 hypothetical protein [Ralstonia phage phiRSL1]